MVEMRDVYAHAQSVCESSPLFEGWMLVFLIKFVESSELCLRVTDAGLLVPRLVCLDGHGERGCGRE